MHAEIGKRYQHYKNGLEYEVTGFAHHTETSEVMVLYKPLYGIPADLKDKYPDGFVFVRPQDMFEEQIEFEGKLIDRFTRTD